MTMTIEDSNLGSIGSEEDAAARKAAAEMEADWEGAGETPGVQIWRIENARREDGSPNFGINVWPEDRHGEFYRGDSYIILKTTLVEESLVWDVFFWIGGNSSQDEYGVAAYKATELDDLLGGVPVQHREVEGHESADFVPGCFPDGIAYLDGGVQSGFRKVVEEEEFTARLLRVKKKGRAVRDFQVPLSVDSLNHNDAFVLDGGESIYTWFGDSCSPFEKAEAAILAANIETARKGKSNKFDDIDENFWELLGGEGDIADEATEDQDESQSGSVRMWMLADGSEGTENIIEVDVSPDSLKEEEAFIVDSGNTVYVWIGQKASRNESKEAMAYAMKYIHVYGKPLCTSVVRVVQGQENQCAFNQDAFGC